ncbi:MAG: transglycosylase family protein [Acidimicrobiales bacterium]
MNAFLMATAMAVSPPVQGPVHEVTPGESLSIIAQCELGDANRWTELAELNRDQIDNPDIIVAGWKLVLPEEGTGECPVRPAVQTNAAAPASAPAQPASAPAPEAPAPQPVAAPAPAPQQPTGGGLASIRACESGGNYGAVSSSGRYRGAYQFDQGTWESVGGSGDPAAASPAEQDQRASILREQRGSSPWPNCG